MIGAITKTNPNYIELECNNVGYLIKVANPFVYIVGSIIKVFLYQRVTDDSIDLYGFKTEDEKELFIKLISVSGIGPKSALSILATGSVSETMNAIDNANATYLMRFPGIGQKASQQIILDLKGKVNFQAKTSSSLDEVREALVALGYKAKEIDKAVKDLDDSLPVSELIKRALQLMLK